MAFQNERSPHREVDLNVFCRCVVDICHIFQVGSIDILYTLDSESLLIKLKPRIFQRLPSFE